MDKIFSNCIIIGFAVDQDLQKIKSYCSITNDSLNIKELRKENTDSLESVVNKELGLKFDKRPRMTFWERRPLLDCQALYAAGDAQVLVDIYLKHNP